MKYSPLHDPKFYVVLLDVIISLATLIVTHYYPLALEITTAIIASVQAIAGVLLKGYFDADTAARAFGPGYPRHILPDVKGPQPK